MQAKFANLYSQKRTPILILIGLCVVLYFVNIGRWDLWDPDEPRYGQVAREMVNGGDWIIMHFNGKVYADKPPLFFWAIALSSFLWKGFHSFSVRFPSAFFGTLTVLLTFFLGKKLYCRRTGFFSALVLATTLEFAYLAVRANIDATLTFFTTASIFCFVDWHFREGQRRRILSIYGFYFSMALATLTKGPVGFILPLLVSLTYLVWQRDWRSIRQMRLVTGMVLFFGIVLAWYLPALAKGGESYLRATLLQHTVERYATGWSHAKPFYYYALRIPVDFLPWSVFLVAATLYGFLAETTEKRSRFNFLFVWGLVIFVFLSFSRGKRGLYLLPIYPGLSLVVGKLWTDWIDRSVGQLKPFWISFAVYGLAIGLMVAGVVAPLYCLKKQSSYLTYSLPGAILLIGTGIAMFFLHRSKHYKAVFGVLVGMAAAAFFYTTSVIFPVANESESGRFLSQEVSARIQPEDKLGVYRERTGMYNFYTGIVPITELRDEGELSRFLQSPGKVFCLAEAKSLSAFQIRGMMPTNVQVITQRRVGGETIVLLSNQ
jgi:4-amino-4-deoxy-L-arabinose transferase-like glycosyltransferase